MYGHEEGRPLSHAIKGDKPENLVVILNCMKVEDKIWAVPKEISKKFV